MTEDFLAQDFMFSPGSIISCETCFGQPIEGEVVAFDYERKVLVIKNLAAAMTINGPSSNSVASASVTTDLSSSNHHHHDVHLLNLNLVGKLMIKSEAKKEDVKESPPNINIPRLKDRQTEAVKERQAVARAHQAGITQDGIKLFLSLTKTIGQPNVTLSDKNIVVNNVVTITSPYRQDNLTVRESHGARSEQNLSYVQQLVQRFWSEQKGAPGVVNNNHNHVHPTASNSSSSFDGGTSTSVPTSGGSSSRSSPDKTTSGASSTSAPGPKQPKLQQANGASKAGGIARGPPTTGPGTGPGGGGHPPFSPSTSGKKQQNPSRSGS